MTERLWGQQAITECLGTISPSFSISKMKISKVLWMGVSINRFQGLHPFHKFPTWCATP